MNEINISVLEDKEDIVYVIFIPVDTDEDIRNYMMDQFPDYWDKIFDHSKFIYIPGKPGDTVEIGEVDMDDLERVTYGKIREIGRNKNEDGD